MTCVEDAGDHYRYRGEGAAVPIPATLQDSLIARLDRFPQAREAAQICSAVGREFSRALVGATGLLGLEALDAGLSSLV